MKTSTLNNDRWRQLEQLFHGVLACGPSKRAGYLDRHCGQDKTLRDQVVGLINSHLVSGDFLETPQVETALKLYAARDRSIPKAIGPYTLHGKIGEGGMAEVYLARDQRLARYVALKILPSWFSNDDKWVNRFGQEAIAASAISHPNVAHVYEVGEFDGSQYIAMEYVEGITLRMRLEQRSPELAEIIDIATQLTRGVAAAHAAGVIHRDLKPENIMLRTDGLLKILDFGLAKLNREPLSTGAEPTVKTDPGLVMGTVAYMSPEQARGALVDGRTDIWSLGAILYEMLAGQQPFRGTSNFDTVATILHFEPLSLSAHGKRVPPALQRILSKALTKDLNKRYQTANDFTRDLQALARVLHTQSEMEWSSPETEKRDTSVRHPERTKERLTDRALSTLSHTARSSVSSLVGRAEDAARLEELIMNQHVRLVTLTGPGGIGKTRLAEVVADRVVEKFGDGVFFVDLSTVLDPELILPTIAQHFGLKETGEKPLREGVKEFLRQREVLVILDNFEHLIAAALLISELLASASRLKVLVTSRALLKLNSEREFALGPLELPPSSLPSNKTLTKYPAITLFVERAQSVRPKLELTSENMEAIRAICVRLDGLPLAIELAAAHVKLLSPKSILRRLEEGLNLLTGGACDVPIRQQTIRNTISWSYDLLSHSDRSILNSLAVFVGGCTVEAAERVCVDNDNSRAEVLDRMTNLVNNSLLVVIGQNEEEPRFKMLEVVREYALELMQQRADVDAIRRRHALFYLSLALESEQEIVGPRQAEWLCRIEQEHDNIRAALRWSIQVEPELALQLCAFMRRFWDRRGHFTEGLNWLVAALEKTTTSPTSDRAKALMGAGQLAQQLGEIELAQAHYSASLALAKTINDRGVVASAYNGLGGVALIEGDTARSETLYKKCLNVSRKSGDERMVTIALSNLGNVAVTKGDLTAARSLYLKSLSHAMDQRNEHVVTNNCTNLGEVCYMTGDFDAAKTYFAKALTYALELSDKRTIASSLDGVAALAVQAGDFVRAAKLLGAVDALSDSIGYKLTPLSRRFRHAYVKKLRAKLGAARLERLESEGRSLGLKQLVALGQETINI